MRRIRQITFYALFLNNNKCHHVCHYSFAHNRHFDVNFLLGILYEKCYLFVYAKDADFKEITKNAFVACIIIIVVYYNNKLSLTFICTMRLT